MSRPNTSQETANIVVCGAASAELDRLVHLTREAGRWGITPVECPADTATMIGARDSTAIYLLHSGKTAPCAALQDLLCRRPDHAGLIVIGHDPARAATPDLWLPSVPPAALLCAMIDQLILADTKDDTEPAPSWRRK